ncbi:hypothetical protein NDU88_001343 [Pleurodeles waltl]|uniref:Reverse transcriptase n=1 Tax=Pleurodeles waltl TaxID=8319 RepID=A0AAV7LCC0_PLEWA|nr:hypothetical protein NDU88_001343 [Pleurodeles waltl]
MIGELRDLWSKPASSKLDGNTRKGKSECEGWFDKELVRAKRDVSLALVRHHDSSASEEKFEEHRRDYKCLLTTKKRLYQNKLWAELRATAANHNTRKFWELEPRVGNGAANVVETCIGPTAWVHYFSTLYRTSVSDSLASRQMQDALFIIPSEIRILIPEVLRALGTRKRNKDPGPDLVPVDVYHKAPHY